VLVGYGWAGPAMVGAVGWAAAAGREYRATGYRADP
jgi:hypothetical protein